jgi:hypothetical protein
MKSTHRLDEHQVDSARRLKIEIDLAQSLVVSSLRSNSTKSISTFSLMFLERKDQTTSDLYNCTKSTSTRLTSKRNDEHVHQVELMKRRHIDSMDLFVVSYLGNVVSSSRHIDSCSWIASL